MGTHGNAVPSQPTLAENVRDEVNRVILHLQDENKDMMVVPYIANVVQSRIDHHSISPEIVVYCSLEHIKQITRRQLRHLFDPLKNAERKADNQETIFDSVLQDHYPVNREVMGETQRVYLRRDLLTHDEVEQIVERMRRVGDALARHADGLEAWDKDRVL